MTDISHRRSFLKATLGTAAAATVAQFVPLAALAREGKTATLTTTRLNEKLVVLSGAGANVVAMPSAEGALLVDGGVEARSSDLVKLALKETGAKKVHTLINTHWHPEQTGSNERLGKAGARITEFPVTWSCDPDSRLRPGRTAVRTIVEMRRIKRAVV